MCKIVDTTCHWDRKGNYQKLCSAAQATPHSCPRSMLGIKKVNELAAENPQLQAVLKRSMAVGAQKVHHSKSSSLRLRRKFFDSAPIRDIIKSRSMRKKIGKLVGRYIALLCKLARTSFKTEEWQRLWNLKLQQESILRACSDAWRGLIDWPKKCFSEALIPVRDKDGKLELYPAPF